MRLLSVGTCVHARAAVANRHIAQAIPAAMPPAKKGSPPAGTRPKKREAAESSSADTRRVAARTEADPAADAETKVVTLKVDTGAAQGPATPAPPAAVLKHNADHLQYIKECLTVVLNHPVMQGVDELPPSPLSSGAPIAPITNEGVISGLAGSSKCATGGANFFSQNWHW